MTTWTVSPYAFKPHKKRDPDGLSFFREDFVSCSDVAIACKHPDGARVVRLKVAAILALGLRVDAAPDPQELAGHVILPNMNAGAASAKSTKNGIDRLTVELARLATRESIYTPRNMGAPASIAK